MCCAGCYATTPTPRSLAPRSCVCRGCAGDERRGAQRPGRGRAVDSGISRMVPADRVIISRGSAMTATRVEHDSLSPVNVPADKLWGAQTQRSAEHLKVAGLENPGPRNEYGAGRSPVRASRQPGPVE